MAPRTGTAWLRPSRHCSQSTSSAARRRSLLFADEGLQPVVEELLDSLRGREVRSEREQIPFIPVHVREVQTLSRLDKFARELLDDLFDNAPRDPGGDHPVVEFCLCHGSLLTFRTRS